jgi:hypothetical protein
MKRWTPSLILKALTARHRRRGKMGHRALLASDRPLLAAAIFHFGTYRKAIEAAGIDFESILGRPVWTKERVIAQIKKARRARRDLCWAAVMKKADPLRRAAFAGMRLFGSWARTLQAAGIDEDDFRRHRTWDRASIAFDLRQRHADGDPVNSAAVQQDDAGLYSAAIRYFSSYDHALKAARLAPSKIRVRKKR